MKYVLVVVSLLQPQVFEVTDDKAVNVIVYVLHDRPVAPATPAAPAAPAVPVAPVLPVGPVKPVGPVAPV
jgi:hypothetical protein